MCVCAQVRANGQGSMCNQAIMLITDGAMEDYESVFEEFNWPERRVRMRTSAVKLSLVRFWSSPKPVPFQITAGIQIIMGIYEAVYLCPEDYNHLLLDF